jgi:DNA topoisomerase-1
VKTALQRVEPDDASTTIPRISEGIETAKAAGLRYVTDDAPGISRHKAGKGFIYRSPGGKMIREDAELRRIRSLAVPPAWRDVWICPLANGHLQATGRDARGRKQHRYHPEWRAIRDQNKYDKLLSFARQLPAIRRQVRKDLALPGLPRAKVLATVIRLLETGMIRVGNEEYARQNNSFGLATLRNRHVDVSGQTIRFEFRGKSGVRHAFDLKDRALARIIRQCRDLPGQELFQYIDEDGERCTIGSGDVNDYLRAVAGDDFSSKDFRTWAGTVLAARSLSEVYSSTGKITKKAITQAIESVAKQLGNTVAVCRKCYIHPAIIDAYKAGALNRPRNPAQRQLPSYSARLKKEEAAVLAMLKASRAMRRARREENLGRNLRASIRRVRRARGANSRATGAPALRSVS